MDDAPKSRSRATALCVALLVVFTGVVFGITVYQRAQWFGYVHPNTEGTMTAVTVVGARNWLDEGIFRLRLGQYWEPVSIETPTLEQRTPYVSFPPGAIVAVYVVARVTGLRPSVEMVMVYNLANQLCVAVVLCLLVFAALRRMGYGHVPATMLSTIPAFLYLLVPTSFFEHQMGYYSDQAVMLPYVLYVLLEVLRTPRMSKRAGRALSVGQGALAFCGILSDWLFAFVALCMYVVRALKGGFGRKPLVFVGRSALFWLPIAVALVLFALQLYSLDAFDDVFARFQDRAGKERPLLGLAPGPREVSAQRFFSFSLGTLFWQEFYRRGLGPFGLVLTFGSLAGLVGLGGYLVVQRLRGKRVSEALSIAVAIMFMGLGPCLLYYQVFKNHCSFLFHFFTTLKFAVPMAIVPFVLLPATLLCLARTEEGPLRGARRTASLVMASVLVVLAAAYAYVQSENRYFYFPKIKREHKAIGNFIAAHTGYEDIVFSPDYWITAKWPQRLVYTWKLVHKIHYAHPAREIYDTVKDIDGAYVINLFSPGPEHYEELYKLERIAALSYEHIEEGDFHLRRIRKRDFLTLCQELDILCGQDLDK